jgi:DNA-binding Lrp family transcriptional regulator
MTDLERSLLNVVQRDFPLEERPFRSLGNRLGISEKKCIALLRRLADDGILAGIRPVISWNKIGFSTVLVGMHVDPTEMNAVAEEINRVDGVTHNYERTGALNLWFTMIYDGHEDKERLFSRLRMMKGVEDLKEFKAEKTYKIGVVLDV